MAMMYRSRHLISSIPPHAKLTPSTFNYKRAVSSKTTKQSQHAEGRDEEVKLPSFSLRDLGLSPTMRIIVYSLIGVIATAETITYGTWAYYKIWPKADEEGPGEK